MSVCALSATDVTADARGRCGARTRSRRCRPSRSNRRRWGTTAAYTPRGGLDHGGGVLGGRDDVGALRVAVLDGRVVALDLVVGVHRGVALQVRATSQSPSSMNTFHVPVVVVVGAHRRAMDGSMTNDRGVDRCSATTAPPAVRGERRWPPGVGVGRAEYAAAERGNTHGRTRTRRECRRGWPARVGSCREGPHEAHRARPRVASSSSSPAGVASSPSGFNRAAALLAGAPARRGAPGSGPWVPGGATRTVSFGALVAPREFAQQPHGLHHHRRGIFIQTHHPEPGVLDVCPASPCTRRAARSTPNPREDGQPAGQEILSSSTESPPSSSARTSSR